MPKGIMSKQDMEARFPPEIWHKYTTESILVHTQSLPVNMTHLDESDEISISIQEGELVPDIVLDSVSIEQIEHACKQNLRGCPQCGCSLCQAANQEEWPG